MERNLTVEEKFTKARIVLLKGDPFIGKYLLLLDKPVECGGEARDNFPVLNDLETMATTGTTLYYNREFVEKLTFEEFLGVLLHQLLHCTTLHPARARGKNEKVWNLACDLWVNSRLKDKQKAYKEERNIRYEFLKSDLFSTDKRILDLSADDLYAELMEQYENQSGTSEKKIGPGGDDENITLQSGSLNVDLGDYSPDMIKPEQVGESSDDLIDKINEMNSESFVHAQLVGATTGLLRQQEIGMQRAPTKWYKYFDRYLKKVFNFDMSYSTPDKNLLYTRRIYKGPTKATSDKLNQVVVAVDSSASVWNDKEVMDKFWFHINNIMKKYSAEGKLLLWSTDVGLSMDLSKFRPNRAYDVPTGGTEPLSIFKYLEDEKIKYDILVILTDGYFKQRDLEKLESYDRKNIIWVISGKYKAYRKLTMHLRKSRVCKL